MSFLWELHSKFSKSDYDNARYYLFEIAGESYEVWHETYKRLARKHQQKASATSASTRALLGLKDADQYYA